LNAEARDARVPGAQEPVEPPVEGGLLGGDITDMGIPGSMPIAMAVAMGENPLGIGGVPAVGVDVGAEPLGIGGAPAVGVDVGAEPPVKTGPLPVAVVTMGSMTPVGPLPIPMPIGPAGP